MRHQRTGKKLGRDSAHRKALYANLTGALIEHGRIKTTVTKAKAVKPIAEQMITLGRRGDLHARRQAVAFLRSKDVVHKLFTEVGPNFAERPGGYLRIVKLGPRPGDAAEMAYLELVDSPLVFKTRLPPEETEEAAEVEAEAGDEEDAEAEAEAAVAVEDAEADTAVAGEAETGAEPEEPSAEAEPAAEDDEPQAAGERPEQ
jgi:large subunit ribosomal protein L17